MLGFCRGSDRNAVGMRATAVIGGWPVIAAMYSEPTGAQCSGVMS